MKIQLQFLSKQLEQEREMSVEMEYDLVMRMSSKHNNDVEG